MAKKKKSNSSTSTKSNSYHAELVGLILILIGVMGFGFGPVGEWLKKGAMLINGEWWPLLLALFVVMGFYSLIKGESPKYFNKRFIGLYLVVIVILMISHLSFIKGITENSQIFTHTWTQYQNRIATIASSNALASSGLKSIAIGGGMIGALFLWASYSLFGLVGTYILMGVMALAGIILLLNVTFKDVLNHFFEKAKEDNENDDEDEEEDNNDPVKIKQKALDKRLREAEEDVSQSKSIVVNSMEEAKKFDSQPKVEEFKAPAVANPSELEKPNPNYHLPPMSILDDPVKNKKINSNQFLINNKQNLERVLKDFQINGKVVDIHMGPSVTQFEVVVPSGMKVSRISSINKEIELALAAKDVRIEAPIPGKSTIGVEIPNQSIAPVKIKEILASKEMIDAKGGLQVALGKDIMGNPWSCDITKMPHLLVAGATGSGKSVCINSMIISLLMRYRPDEVKIVLVDPKQVELSNYNGVPHLLCPVVTDPKKASVALQNIVSEMDKRYHMFADKGAKKIDDYNHIIDEENKKHPETPTPRMNYIVVIVDEMADLMLAARKEVEDSIMRITQLARAAGIHLIVATQRPSTDVITGVVKANIPSRIAFTVASNIDSRTILDASGAEKLLGKGDMLFLPMGANQPTRIQGCYISDDEIRRVIEAVCKEQKAVYDESITMSSHSGGEIPSGISGGDADEYEDPMYDEVVEFAVQTGKISASLLQRRFRFGYNRAARVVDLLEERGIVGPQNGSKPREVLLKVKNTDDGENENQE